MGLFIPVYMKSSLEGKKLKKAIEAVERLKGEALINAAEKAPVEEVRIAANQRYQLFLVDIIGSNAPMSEKWAAWAKLTCPKLAEKFFVELAVADDDPPDIALTRIKNILDQDSLFLIVTKARSEKIRIAALNAMTDDSVIAKIPFSTTDASLRLMAVGRLTDQSELVGLALSDLGTELCLAALRRVDDPKLLEEIALTSRDKYVKKEAIQRINDPAIWTEIATSDLHPTVRGYAVEMLTDQDVLKEIALNDPDEIVRRTAAGRLDDKSIFYKITSGSAQRESFSDFFSADCSTGDTHSSAAGCSHKWEDVPGSEVVTIDCEIRKAGYYIRRCVYCGKVQKVPYDYDTDGY